MGVVDQLQVEFQKEADRVIVRLAGELDMANAPLLQAAIEGGEADVAPMLVLDVEQLLFIDSTGLRVILWARERCQDRGQKMALTRGPQQMQRLLAVSGTVEHLHIIASADEMLV